jgi:LytS/YehU family sensor histidine kinase
MTQDEAHRLLLDAARLLSSSLDVDATVAQVIELAVPRLADECEVYLHGSPGTRAPARGRWRELRAAIARACSDARPVLLGPAERGSYAVVPLVVHGASLGALILTNEASGRRLDQRDHALAELLETFGARAALALDNARLHAELRRAHEAELRASRLEAQLIQARLEALRAQLNPHFLFNALNTIAMLVRRQANAEALRGIVGLSQLLRQVLDRRAAPEVSLGEELALVEHFLAIEQLRYPDRLRVRIQVDPDVLEAQVPNLLLQPLVENAVRHGIGRREDAGIVEIVARRRRGALTLQVWDDGPGLPDGWRPEADFGLGLANTRERLQRLYGRRHRFELRNDARGGVRALVRIPFHLARAA